jgi:hypothetical protein
VASFVSLLFSFFFLDRVLSWDTGVPLSLYSSLSLFTFLLLGICITSISFLWGKAFFNLIKEWAQHKYSARREVLAK